MAESTARSKGFGTKSSPPRSMAMTIFMLSETEERKIIGTREIFRISAHQW